MENTKKSKGINIGIVAVIAVAVIIVVGLVVKVLPSKGATAKLGDQIELSAHEPVTFKNGDDKITLTIDSDIAFSEEGECKLEYTLNVNEEEYKGEYTFAVGYSIHSEPTNIPYRVSFIDAAEGFANVTVKQAVNENESDAQ